jgi:hypothetical protein
MKWIRSAGGPLICIGSDLAGLWMGIHGNSLSRSANSPKTSDYVRACEIPTYLGKIQIGGGEALILGDIPMETTVFASPCTAPLIVRVVYKDPDADVLAILTRFGRLDSMFAVERMSFRVAAEKMSIFDSADLQKDSCDASLALVLEKANYEVRTFAFEPDERTAVVVHEFAIAN